MSLNVTIGLGILAALFILIAFKLDEKHNILKIICFMFGIWFMTLMGNHVNATQNYCQNMVANETWSNGTATYEYERVCFDYDYTTGETTLTLLIRVTRIIQWYIFIYICYLGLKQVGIIDKLVDKLGKMYKW